MNDTITIQSRPLKFNYKHLLLLIAITALLFILSNALAVKQSVENVPEFSVEDAEGLMEEIYSAGEITEALKNLPLDAAIIKKMCAEIERQLAKNADHPGCEVYNLVALQSAEYPVLGYGDAIMKFDYLNAGEAWKVGMTCNGEDGRYKSDSYYKCKDGSISLTKNVLRYQPIFKWTYKQAIILEKILIYTYPLWSGHPDYAKPFGNKIFR